MAHAHDPLAPLPFTRGLSARARARLAGTLALVGAVAGCADVPAAPADDATPTRPAALVALPDSVAAEYWRDAVTLALRELRRGRSVAEQPIEVPAESIESLYRALAAVHAARQIPARDSVVELYRIHAAPEPGELLVAVDSAVPWTRAWARGELATGNRAVDEIVERYGLTLARYYRWSIGETALLGTTRPLNLAALAPLLAGIPGVRYAQPNEYCCDGNTITARALDGGWELEYSLGYGDCPAGCTARRHWTFAVDAAGQVTYRGSRGSPPPGRPGG